MLSGQSGSYQQTRDTKPMLVWCLSTIHDGGSTSTSNGLMDRADCDYYLSTSGHSASNLHDGEVGTAAPQTSAVPVPEFPMNTTLSTVSPVTVALCLTSTLITGCVSILTTDVTYRDDCHHDVIMGGDHHVVTTWFTRGTPSTGVFCTKLVLCVVKGISLGSLSWWFM